MVLCEVSVKEAGLKSFQVCAAAGALARSPSYRYLFVCACRGVLQHVCKLEYACVCVCVCVCVIPQPYMLLTCVSQTYKH